MKKFFFLLLVCSFSLYAQEINFYGEANPGSIVIGSGKNITGAWLDKQKLLVSNEGIFVFGFDKNAKGKHVLKVKFKRNKTKTFEYALEEQEYSETQSLRFQKKYVKPPKRERKKIRKETQQLLLARAKIGKSTQAFYKDGFAYPVDSINITTVFGTERILNGKTHNFHNGVDFSADEGDTVKAITDGIVRLTGSNFYYNGSCVIVDHGQGLSSIYLHLSKIIVKNKAKIKKGDVIGLAGSTGRSTGPHVHLGVQWYKKRIDPMSLFDINLP